MKLSKYVKTVEYGDNVIIYHTIEHSIIQLPKEVLEGRIIKDEFLDDDSITTICEMKFFDNTDLDYNIPSLLINDKKLFISVELNLSCNLRCPYCYQAGKQTGKTIKDSDLNYLLSYINNVYQLSPFTDLYLKILGGEPTLVWSKLLYLYNSTKEICQKNGIKLHLLIDTNGTIIENFNDLIGYSSILFTIPLSSKRFHNKMRFDSKGNGTYDLIIDNINKIKEMLPESKIVIRYNVDSENISDFEDFLFDIKSKLKFLPLVSVNYTAELNSNKDFGNGLSYENFIDWLSSKAIDSLLSAELPVTISPVISAEECQYRSRYSLKIFSDGTVGSCAMSFFDENREHISDVISNMTDNNSFFANKQHQTIINQTDCLKCDSLFICGGTCRLPCIKALDSNACERKMYGIDLKKFLPRYINSQEKGNSHLFVVFENGESYR